MKTKAKVSLIVVGVVLAVLFVALMIYYFGASYPAFDAVAKQEFLIPGLDSKFSPQGLAYSEETENFIVSGYMSDKTASRFYFIKKGENAATKYITLTVNSELYKGHCGGVTIDGDYVFVVGDKKVYRFSLSEALLTENAQTLEVIDGFETSNGADFVLTYQGKLIVGEFYRKQNYKTPESHHIKTSSGETNVALSYIYTINQKKTGGVELTTPEAGISMPKLVQGMTFTKDGKIVLSTSYALPDSKLLIYNNVLESEPTHTANIDGKEIPVYMLDNNALTSTLKAPCMSEEIVLVEGRVYVLFESNCKQYRLFTRTRLSNVYSLDI